LPTYFPHGTNDERERERERAMKCVGKGRDVCTVLEGLKQTYIFFYFTRQTLFVVVLKNFDHLDLDFFFIFTQQLCKLRLLLKRESGSRRHNKSHTI
jgi:hypothetical protein